MRFSEEPEVGGRPRESPPLDLVAIEPPSLIDRIAPFLEGRRLVALGALGAGVIIALAAAWVILRPVPPAIEDVLPVATAPAMSTPGPTAAGAGLASPSTVATVVLVHAAGSVAAPGVYELPSGARVADLLAAAGGAHAEADLDRLNLAEPLVDGTRIYVPSVGEEVPPELAPPPSPAGPVAGDAPAGAGPVNLNTASAEELDSLPGVGPATSEAIIRYRTESGGFASVDELLDVSGIGEAKLEQLRDLVTVG